MEETKRYTIAYRGLRSGLHDFHFKVDGGLFRAYGSTEIKDGDCDVSVALERGESMLTLDVTVDGSVVVECDRCLEDCNVPIHYEGQLLVKFSDEVHEYDGEVMWLLPMEDEVDLTQYIYESIVLALPYQRVHPDGECNPEMLERFRIVSDEEFGGIEARAEAEAATKANGPSWPRSRSRWRPTGGTGRKQNERNKLFPAGEALLSRAGEYLTGNTLNL